jgi:hypothetical protein
VATLYPGSATNYFLVKQVLSTPVRNYHFSVTQIFRINKMAKFLNIFRSLGSVRNISSLSTNIHAFNCDVVVPKPAKLVDAWIENIDKIEEEKCGLVELHPQIFRTTPRIDIGD